MRPAEIPRNEMLRSWVRNDKMGTNTPSEGVSDVETENSDVWGSVEEAVVDADERREESCSGAGEAGDGDGRLVCVDALHPSFFEERRAFIESIAKKNNNSLKGICWEFFA